MTNFVQIVAGVTAKAVRGGANVPRIFRDRERACAYDRTAAVRIPNR